ncbi:transcriptional repressor [Aeromicrobium senzhongii]|uniref:Transcriptional repressor n=1 Tax=Aeromicrobium senzhongii TaxID=2663859 RepID=A0ABX6SV37_9ACTN|nr:Fur family transcriptional regulator [Aeromicrobium senzhongii]MTB87843.1 transcriptional repressor [Aeromicrobium senzhongii]QNL95137.1 transcriptional repressor [Aeromicrobium senzhongii]
MPHSPDLEQALRAAGLRVTRQRTAVLHAVTAHPHSDTAAIIDRARETIPDLSHQAVYDSLHALTDAGVVRCIEPAGSAARYETRTGDNHHHLVCRSCSRIVDVDCTIGAAPCLTPGQDHGFVIDEAEVVFWGLCPSCSPATPEPIERTLHV